MKMYPGVLARARQIECKKGIRYADTGSFSYILLRRIFMFLLIVTLIINSVYIIGGSLEIYDFYHGGSGTYDDDGREYTNLEYWKNTGVTEEKIATIKMNTVDRSVKIIISTSICIVSLVVSYLLIRFKLHLIGGIATICAILFSVFTFKAGWTNVGGIIGVNAKFYWAHLLPLSLLAITVIWFTVIAVKAEIKTKKAYKKTVETLYDKYCANLPEGETVSDADWDKYLSEYDPYKETAENKKKKNKK